MRFNVLLGISNGRDIRVDFAIALRRRALRFAERERYSMFIPARATFMSLLIAFVLEEKLRM
jgi:hypothetical protein